MADLVTGITVVKDYPARSKIQFAVAFVRLADELAAAYSCTALLDLHDNAHYNLALLIFTLGGDIRANVAFEYFSESSISIG